MAAVGNPPEPGALDEELSDVITTALLDENKPGCTLATESLKARRTSSSSNAALVLTLFGAREQVKFSQRPRPRLFISHRTKDFRALGYLWHPIDGGYWTLFPQLEPPLHRIPRDDTTDGLVTRLGTHHHRYVGLTPLGELSVGKGLLATVNTVEHSTLSIMGYRRRCCVYALSRASLKIGTYSQFWSLKAQPLLSIPGFGHTGLATATTLGLCWLWRRLEIQATR